MAYAGQVQTISTTAFGDVEISQMTGQIQIEFPADLSLQLTKVKVASSGTVISQPPFAVLYTGTSNTGSASIYSRDRLQYENGAGALIFFSAVYSSGVDYNQQYVGVGDSFNGFFFGWNGTTFGILFRSSVYGSSVTSITTVDTWIYQGAWNGDPLDGSGGSGFTLNPTNGNIYKIQMPWLGFGAINFFIQDPNSEDFIQVHQIQYANSFTATAISNPNLPVSAYVYNQGNTTNVSLQVPFLAAFIEGDISPNNIRYSAVGSNNGLILDNLVLSIQNMYTFNGILNHKSVRPDFISAWVNGNAHPFIIRLSLNPILSTSSYIQVSTGTSVVQYCSADSQTIFIQRQSANRSLAFFVAGVTQQINLDISSLGIILNPGDVLGVSSNSVSTASAVFCSLSWTEEF